jgi:hypothetical protein
MRANICLTVTKGDRFVFGSLRDNYNTRNGELIYLDSCCMSFYSVVCNLQVFISIMDHRLSKISIIEGKAVMISIALKCQFKTQFF